jgi:hypothetical protein
MTDFEPTLGTGTLLGIAAGAVALLQLATSRACSTFGWSMIPFSNSGAKMAGTAYGADPAQDPAVTTYGTLNRAAPAELATFPFLVGKWTGTGKYRDAEGKDVDFAVLWIGRYALDGMAIVDENRRAESEGGAIQGLTLRFFDPGTKTWTIEFLNFGRSFLRKQTNSNSGAVTRNGTKITISQSGPEGAPGREVYTVVDADHFTYSMDVMKDGAWDDGLVTMKLERQQ